MYDFPGRAGIEKLTQLIKGKLADVATSGSYSDLSDKPTISNPNLLINPDFGINQRAVSGEFSEAGKYFVDRWKLDSGSVSINSDGTLTLNGTISQILENTVGTNVTASVSAGTASYDDSTKAFTITGNGDIISWAKLETGSAATLFTSPDPAAELMKCQRYYYRIRNQSAASRQMLAIGYAYSAALMNLILNFPNCMRTPPTIIISDPAIFLYSKTTESAAASMTNVARNGCMAPYNSITLKCTGSFTANSAYQIFLEKSGYIEFNAEL